MLVHILAGGVAVVHVAGWEHSSTEVGMERGALKISAMFGRKTVFAEKINVLLT